MKNKLIFSLILGMFFLVGILGNVSAELFSFDNIKQYDKVTKTVTIVNTFGLGTDIATIQLKTPLIVKTGYGGVSKVAEFELNSLEDYTSAFDKMEFYNVNDGMKSIERDFEYKIRSYENVFIYDYEKDCSKDCKIIGNHTEQREIWTPLEKSDFLKDEVVTIGIFTYVYEGDYVEWIPTFYGKEIDEWAYWTTGLDAGLISYYAFENNTHLQNNVSGGVDGVVVGTLTEAVAGGANGQYWNFTGTGGVNLTGIIDTAQTYTFQFWLKGTAPAHDSFILDIGTGRIYLLTYGTGVGGDLRAGDTVERKFDTPVGSSNLTLNSWQHIIYITNTTGWFLFVNGTKVGANTTRVAKNIGGTISLGTTTDFSTQVYKGGMDEVGIWNRSLSQAEITTLYGGGSPPTYGDYEAVAVDVILNAPTNYFNMTGNRTIYFIANVTDSQKVQNVSLYLDGVLNETNTSNVNGTYIFTKTLDLSSSTYINNTVHNWSILAYNNQSLENQSITRYLISDYFWVNSVNYTTTVYETEKTYHWINITSNNTLTSANLYLGGTQYTGVKSGTIWNTTVYVPSSSGNKSIIWELTYDGNKYNTSANYQTVAPILFGLCNTTLTVPYLNLTFKDEATDDWMTASIPSSTFVYYLGDGTVNKTLSFINNTVNSNYSFCSLPANKTYHIDAYLQYKNGTDYPQRIWNPDVGTYTNATSNVTLYLLSATDGIYVTFQVINTGEQLLSGVEVTASRLINSVSTTVASGTTGADGTVTFWLNPDFSHDLVFIKTGYTTYTTSLIPTQTSYTITMAGGGSVVAIDYTRGIRTYIYPKKKELTNDTSYNFIFNVTSSYWELTNFGFNLRLANGTIVGTGISAVEGTGASSTYDVNNQSIIYIDYYWNVGGNYTNSSTYWVITNSLNTGWSIKTFFVDSTLYLDSGIFGLDNFGRYLISFLVLFLIVGFMGYKFGATSPVFITVLTFSVVFFLDVITGLIPAVRGIEHLVTYLAGLIMVVVIIGEIAR